MREVYKIEPCKVLGVAGWRVTAPNGDLVGKVTGTKDRAESMARDHARSAGYDIECTQ